MPPSIVKHRTDAPPGFFEAEAAGLRWLAATTAVGGAPVVKVIESRPGAITLEQLVEVTPTGQDAATFGRALAATHAAGAGAFGIGPDGGPGIAWIGRQDLPLGRFDSWGVFYADTRLMPYARAARDIDQLSPRAMTDVERVCDRLRAGDFDDGRPPARIHGDLWTGNVMWTEHGGTMIDPAAHGGHGQTDLAMLSLFGAPFLTTIEFAYAEAANLDTDWRDRTELHQLHPLLVHAVTHGPSYGSAAGKLARRYV